MKMITEYCFTPNAAHYFLTCYGVVACVALIVAILELLNRYGAGNRASWVLSGRPQTIFYLVNISAAIITLFVSEATGATKVVELAATDLPSAIIKCFQLGLGSMFVLRSRLISIEKKDKSGSIDLGPSQILNIIYRYLERLTDQSRGKNAMQEVESIMSDFKGSLTDLTALCLRIPEAIPEADIEKLKRTLDVIVRNGKKLSKRAQMLLMGLELQKEVGTATLRAAVAALGRDGQTEAQSPADPADSDEPSPGPESEDDMVLLDNLIEEELRKFNDEKDLSAEGGKSDGDRK